MLKVKLQYFGHLMQRADSLGKTLTWETIERKRRSVPQRMRCLDSITDSMDMNLCKLWGTVKEGEPGVLQPMGSQRVRYDLATEQQQQYSLRVCLFVKSLSLFFNWNIIALQYYLSFCGTMKWINYMYPYLPSSRNFPPTPHLPHLSRSFWIY